MGKARTSRPVVVSVVSDVHAGSTVALSPPRIALDDGGAYEASKTQRWLWQCWEAYWKRVAEVVEQEGADLYTVFNGDLIEGDHHNTSQIASRNPNAQAGIVNAAMAVPLSLKADRIFVIRGTEAHVGQSASGEERIADGLRRDKRPVEGDPETGTASWWHWRGLIHNTLLDITHHGRTGQREHTRGSAAVLHAHDIFLSHTKNGERHPDLCFRGHYHRFNDSYDACPTRVITTGAWQLKTGHVHKVAADSMADIGGAITIITEKGYEVEKVKYKASRGPIWQLSK